MRLLYFAWVREKIGASREDLDLPVEVQTVGGLIVWLQGRDAGHAAAFADAKLVRCAVDQEMVGFEASITGASEIAFFPPVTGG